MEDIVYPYQGGVHPEVCTPNSTTTITTTTLNLPMTEIIITRRLTSTFLRALPAPIDHFNAHLYAIVARKPHAVVPGETGKEAFLDPCVLDWKSRTLTIHIPIDINPGIRSVDDLDPDFYDAVQAAFLSLAYACV